VVSQVLELASRLPAVPGVVDVHRSVIIRPLNLSTQVIMIHKSMSLKYEPASDRQVDLVAFMNWFAQPPPFPSHLGGQDTQSRPETYEHAPVHGHEQRLEGRDNESRPVTLPENYEHAPVHGHDRGYYGQGRGLEGRDDESRPDARPEYERHGGRDQGYYGHDTRFDGHGEPVCADRQVEGEYPPGTIYARATTLQDYDQVCYSTGTTPSIFSRPF